MSALSAVGKVPKDTVQPDKTNKDTILVNAGGHIYEVKLNLSKIEETNKDAIRDKIIELFNDSIKNDEFGTMLNKIANSGKDAFIDMSKQDTREYKIFTEPGKDQLHWTYNPADKWKDTARRTSIAGRGSISGESKPKPAESRPAESRPKPAESKPAESRPKPAESKPAESKPAESRPKPAESRPGSGLVLSITKRAEPKAEAVETTADKAATATKQASTLTARRARLRDEANASAAPQFSTALGKPAGGELPLADAIQAEKDAQIAKNAMKDAEDASRPPGSPRTADAAPHLASPAPTSVATPKTETPPKATEAAPKATETPPKATEAAPKAEIPKTAETPASSSATPASPKKSPSPLPPSDEQQTAGTDFESPLKPTMKLKTMRRQATTKKFEGQSEPSKVTEQTTTAAAPTTSTPAATKPPAEPLANPKSEAPKTEAEAPKAALQAEAKPAVTPKIAASTPTTVRNTVPLPPPKDELPPPPPGSPKTLPPPPIEDLNKIPPPPSTPRPQSETKPKAVTEKEAEASAAPKTEASKTAAPKVETPKKAEAPKVEPKVETPKKAEAPKAEPKVEAAALPTPSASSTPTPAAASSASTQAATATMNEKIKNLDKSEINENTWKDISKIMTMFKNNPETIKNHLEKLKTITEKEKSLINIIIEYLPVLSYSAILQIAEQAKPKIAKAPLPPPKGSLPPPPSTPLPQTSAAPTEQPVVPPTITTATASEKPSPEESLMHEIRKLNIKKGDIHPDTIMILNNIMKKDSNEKKLENLNKFTGVEEDNQYKHTETEKSLFNLIRKYLEEKINKKTESTPLDITSLIEEAKKATVENVASVVKKPVFNLLDLTILPNSTTQNDIQMKSNARREKIKKENLIGRFYVPNKLLIKSCIADISSYENAIAKNGIVLLQTQDAINDLVKQLEKLNKLLEYTNKLLKDATSQEEIGKLKKEISKLEGKISTWETSLKIRKETLQNAKDLFLSNVNEFKNLQLESALYLEENNEKIEYFNDWIANLLNEKNTYEKFNKICSDSIDKYKTNQDLFAGIQTMVNSTYEGLNRFTKKRELEKDMEGIIKFHKNLIIKDSVNTEKYEKILQLISRFNEQSNIVAGVLEQYPLPKNSEAEDPGKVPRNKAFDNYIQQLNLILTEFNEIKFKKNSFNEAPKNKGNLITIGDASVERLKEALKAHIKDAEEYKKGTPRKVIQ